MKTYNPIKAIEKSRLLYYLPSDFSKLNFSMKREMIINAMEKLRISLNRLSILNLL